jgi:hypothetical protein
MVAFLNTLAGSGVTSTTDGTIWLWNPTTRAFSLVAREGTPIDFGNSNVRTPLNLSFRGGEGRPAGLTSGLNDATKVVFEALCTDFKEMIAVAAAKPPVDLRITSIAKDGTGVLIQGRGVPLAAHTVKATADLSQPFQTIGATPVADGSGNFQFSDTANLTKRFYMVVFP